MTIEELDIKLQKKEVAEMDNETRDRIRRLEDRALFLEIFEDLGVDVDRFRDEK